MQTTQPNIDKRRLSPDDVRKVAPALEAYTQERLYGEVWKRPGLSARDRSLITIAALIARDQAPALTYYFNQALENGVEPREISEVITHLAFYTGWANAFAAVGPARDVFATRGIGADQIPAASVQRLPLHEAAEVSEHLEVLLEARQVEADIERDQCQCGLPAALQLRQERIVGPQRHARVVVPDHRVCQPSSIRRTHGSIVSQRTPASQSISFMASIMLS